MTAKNEYQDSLVKFDIPSDTSDEEDEKEEDKNKKVKKETEEERETKNILRAMFKPREWDKNEKKYLSYVSAEPANREKARNLFKALDEKIKERQAREKGICPIREELYSQCFDEIIRQVTIECPERGLLLMRVRDEIKMTVSSYQTLYESAVLFGIKKQLQAEEGKKELEEQEIVTEQELGASGYNTCFSQEYGGVEKLINIGEIARRGNLVISWKDEVQNIKETKGMV